MHLLNWPTLERQQLMRIEFDNLEDCRIIGCLLKLL